MNTPNPEVSICGIEALRRRCIFQIAFEFETADALNLAKMYVHDTSSGFAAAGALGAYAEKSDDSLFVYIGHSEYLQTLVTRFEVSSLNFRALQLLRNMLSLAGEANLNIRHINVMPEGKNEGSKFRLPQISSVDESECYPTIRQDHPHIACTDADFSKSRRVLVEFGNRLSEYQILKLRDLVDAWYWLLEKGAFSQPFGSPPDIISIRGKLTLFDATTYEIHVVRYIASEAGFNILVNVLTQYSLSESKIKNVLID